MHLRERSSRRRGDQLFLRKSPRRRDEDRKSTRLNSSHSQISYAVFCLKKKIEDQHVDENRHDQVFAEEISSENRLISPQSHRSLQPRPYQSQRTSSQRASHLLYNAQAE